MGLLAKFGFYPENPKILLILIQTIKIRLFPNLSCDSLSLVS